MTADTTTETNALQTAAPTEVGAMALMTLKPETYAAEVYLPFKTRLAAAIESVRNIDYDIKTAKGLEVVTKARRTMMDIRIEANKQREARKAPIIQIGKLLESSYKAVEENILPLETFFDGEIKAEEGRKEDEKQAKIASERLRVEEIQKKIDEFGVLALQAVGRDSRGIDALQQVLIGCFESLTEKVFEEFLDKAKAAYAAAESSLDAACKAAMQAEQDAEAARIQREEEDRQRAAEAAKLEAQLQEQAKIAAAQEAERKRLAEVASKQAEELANTKREAEEKIKAAAEKETARIQAEADARAREYAKAMQALNDQRAAFEAEKAAAQKVKDDAAQLEADHSEALAMNAEWTPPVQEQEIPGIQTIIPTGSDPGFKSLSFDSSAIADALIAESLDAPEAEPTDEEIVEVYIASFGGTAENAIERLQRFAATLAA